MSYDFNNKSAHKKRIFVAPIGRSCQPSHTNIQAIAHCFELQPKDARKRLSLRRLSLSSLLTVVPRVNADPRTSNSKAVPATNRSSKLGACRNRRRYVDDMMLLVLVVMIIMLGLALRFRVAMMIMPQMLLVPLMDTMMVLAMMVV